MRILAFCFLTLMPLWAQEAWLRPADPVWMPGVADSNSPLHWWRGTLYLHNSDGLPIRSQGESIFALRHARAVLFYSGENSNKWIESTWVDPEGVVWAWFHHEVFLDCGEGIKLSAPVIGALVSYDGGWTYHELGRVLASGSEPNCSAQNGYFAGGHGDFTVLIDEAGEYFYFYFSTYAGDTSEQGIAVARMRVEDRADPVGNVWKYFDGAWEEPGLYGRVSPAFPAAVDWGQENADAFWGPSLHYNTYLGQYVALLNRSCCAPGWPQEGVYVSFNRDLGDPQGWSEPRKIISGGSWYPQIVGLGPEETDKRTGSFARFFVGGHSEYEIVFAPPD